MVKKKLKPPALQKGNKINTPDNLLNEISAELKPPIFSFQYLQENYCISHCSKDQKIMFVDKLRILGKKTWRELKQINRQKLGYEKISRKSLNLAIPSCITDDVSFIAFRFAGLAAMIGYRDKDVFHIIWLDRNFTVYDHG